MRLRFLLFLFTALLFSACGGDPTPRHITSQPSSLSPRGGGIPKIAPPQIYGQSAIVIDARSGEVLYAKNADQRRPVASTQKIITALVALDAGNLNKEITIRSSDTHCEPTKLYLRPGEVYTRGYLTKALIVKSGNDVARALARDLGGSQEGFSVLMNRKATSLGMRNSHFVNPNGLPAAGQYSTARDIAIAARTAYRSSTMRSWTNTQKYTFQYSDGRTKVLENTNKLLKRVPYCDGMKTGTTNAAGRCLVASGTYQGRSAISVVLKSNSANIWDDSERLLRWALETPRR
ncbi:MAG: D-alanyl-D-alanine carboxypeptidase family protein [Verrucomicrobiales bacterium]